MHLERSAPRRPRTRRIWHICQNACACALLLLCTAIARPLIDQPWGEHFSERRNDAGDLLSATAVFANSDAIFLYDLGTRSIAVFDLSGAWVRSVALESIGRGSYAGDDFVLYKNRFTFLNTVDLRIELFDTLNGIHSASVAYPRDLLPRDARRSRQIVTRIFTHEQDVLLGNAHVAVPVTLDARLGKAAAQKGIRRAPEPYRFELLSPVLLVYATAECRVLTKNRSFDIQPSPIPISGKRLTIVRGKPAALRVAPGGIYLDLLK
jgi:hypothetical protein